MRRLTGFTRYILFLTSFLPLVIIFLIVDFKELAFPFFNHPRVAWCTIGLIVVLLIFVQRFIAFFLRPGTGEQWNVNVVESMESEVLSYIFSNILPMLGFKERRLAVILFLLPVIGVIYINSNMIGINPTLNVLFRFHILKAEIGKPGSAQSKPVILLSRLSYWELKLDASINAVQIHDEIYMVQGRVK